MVQPEPPRFARAAVLLALGGILGLAGLVLVAGRGALQLAPAEPFAKILRWGPKALVGVGLALVLSAAAMILANWMQRRP